MEEVPRGSNTFFCISPGEQGKANQFGLKHGNLSGRFDAQFHKPHFHYLTQTLNELGSVTLGSIVEYSKETWDRSDERFAGEFPYIEISGVGLGTNDYEVSWTPISEAPSRARQVVRADDILVSLTRPSRGAGLLVLTEHDGAIASTGFAVIRDVDAERVDRDYLLLCLTGPLGTEQMLMRSSGGSYPAITKSELSQILIPLIPIEMQRILVAAMKAAQEERRAKLEKAENLLASIDDYFFDVLDITPPPEDRGGVFGIEQRELSVDSLGPSFYSPELRYYLRRLSSSFPTTQPLSNYVSVNPPVDVSTLDASDFIGFIPMQAVSDGATGDYTYVTRPLEEVRQSYTAFVDGDILWAKITPCMQNGKVCIVDGLPNAVGFGSTEFHVLRVHADGVSTEFVKEFISQATLRRIATYVFTGSAGQQRVPARFLEDLPFPKLSEDEQEEIVASISEVREEARRLRSDAYRDWNDAKSWFQEHLLGHQDK